jgi:hypothetical protein
MTAESIRVIVIGKCMFVRGEEYRWELYAWVNGLVGIVFLSGWVCGCSGVCVVLRLCHNIKWTRALIPSRPNGSDLHCPKFRNDRSRRSVRWKRWTEVIEMVGSWGMWVVSKRTQRPLDIANNWCPP